MGQLDRTKLLDWAFGHVFEAEERELIEQAVASGFAEEFPAELIDDSAAEDELRIDQMIREMTIPQKIKLALFGNKTARAFLLRDNSTKTIPLLVLKNPRITETEINEIAKNTTVDEQVLRALAGDSTWMRNYSMKLSIVSNPKVPVDVALKWVKHIQQRDLRRLSRSKNLSQVVVAQCRKLLEKREQN